MITDEHLLLSRENPGLGGDQRIYKFKNGYGLSLINSPMAHHYPFAWEAAVIAGVRDDGTFDRIEYETDLGDIHVFDSDDKANDFIFRAAALFGK